MSWPHQLDPPCSYLMSRCAADPCALVRRVAVCLGAAKDLEEVSASPRWMARNNLAGAYESAGRPGEAIGLYEQNLADSVRVLGEDHPDTLTARNNLAHAFSSAGRPGQAIPLYEQNLADSVRVLGEDHPQTLSSRNNLAYAYQFAERLGEAIPPAE